MAQYPHLKNAPIVEALIDFRVRTPEGFDVKSLLALHEPMQDRFPVRKEARRFQSEFQISEDEGAAHSSKVRFVGYRFETADASKVWQVQDEGFTLSHLKPYDRWETLVAEAKELWKLYADVVKPLAITRVATRFINRIELPAEGLDFDDYLTVPPRIPPALPQMFVEFVSRVVVPEPTLDALIVIAQALEPMNPMTNTLPVLIDIDAFKEAAFDINGDEHWEVLSQLRTLKNDAFFSSITTKTVELCS